jgi:hypothetical protein
MSAVINIERARDVLFFNTNVTGGSSSAGTGLLIGSNAHHVRFVGGLFKGGGKNFTILKVDAGASDIVLDEVRFYNDPNDQGLVSIDPNAKRIRAGLLYQSTTPPFDWTVIGKSHGMIGSLLMSAESVSVRGYDIWRVVPGPMPTNIETFIDGYDGQILTLLGPTGGSTVSLVSGGNIHLASAPYVFSSSNATIRLVYDAATASWLELSRT